MLLNKLIDWLIFIKMFLSLSKGKAQGPQ